MSNATDPTPDDLPPIPPPPPPLGADSDVPLALTDADEVAEILPAAEVVADAVAFDLPDVPGAGYDRTMGGMALADIDLGDLPPIPPAVRAGESWGDEDALPAVVPAAEPAASSAIFDASPVAAAEEVVDLAAAPMSASSLFGESVPEAGPASGFIPAAAAAGDSAVSVDKPPPEAAVSPASGWYTPEEGTIPTAPPADGIEAELAGPLPHTGHGDGSDIFAAAPPPAGRLLADQSDVIAATSPRDADPFAPPPVRAGARPSEVALTFDQPPGGSTINDPAAAADLPVADEVPEAESLFGDSATLAHADPLPGADAADFGAIPAGSADASSILADLIEPARPLTDGSAVRIEAPGLDPTLSDEPAPAEFRAPDATADDGSLWDADDDALSAEGTGSDLFAESRPPAGPRFELTPDAPGMVDPFAGVDESEEPSLGSASASIFTPPTMPAVPGSGELDAVEFSDHPDPAAAAAGLDFGAVDFDLGGDAAMYPDRTFSGPIADDDALDLTDPGRPALPPPSTGDVLAAAGKEGAGDWPGTPEPTDILRTGAGASGVLGWAKPPAPGDSGFAPQPAVPAARPGRTPTPRPQQSSGSVELDWVAGSSTSDLALPAEPRVARPGAYEPAASDDGSDDDATGPTRLATPVGAASGGQSGNGRAAAGLAFGLLLGVSVAGGGAYFGAFNKSDAPKSVVSANPPGIAPGATRDPVAAPVTVADARAALDAGDPARALKAIEAAGATTAEAKAARGQARLLARLREATAPAADDEGLKAARADLEAVVADADAAKTPAGERAAVRAAVHLGLTHEVAGDAAKAKEVYGAAAKQFPNAAPVFQAALDRLDALAPPVPAGATSLRIAPADAERLALAATFLFLQDEPAPAAEPAEAGGHFWRAANLAAGGKYADAADAIDAAKKAHVARARALAGRGLNPLTDPLEQIFPRSCDDLKAYWELRRTLYDHKGVGVAFRDQKDVGKVLDGFAALKTDRDAARADLKLADTKLVAAQKGLLAEQEALKAEKAALKAEKETSTKLTTDLAKAGDDLKKSAADLVKEKAAAVALMKDADAAKKLADDFNAKAKTLDAALALSEKARKDADAVVAGVAAELKGAKLLPEKHAPADVIAAAKSAASRATGPDLTSLIPPGVAATVGAPATTGTLLDLAARAGKHETAAKQAALALTAANAKYTADFTKAKTDHDAAMKLAADAHAAALKKTADDAAKLLTATKTEADKTLAATKTDAAAVLTKTKTDAAADLAKVTKEAMAADAKLKADHTAAVTKLKADYDGTLTKLKADHKTEVTAAEKKLTDTDAAAKAALAATEKRFRAELENAVSPAEALPLWQAMLTELRRPADADPALAAALRVLKTAPPESEAAGRANALAGSALGLKGNAEAARVHFERARRSPAYAADKDWARAADVGLAALTDPAAASRVAVDGERRRDPRAYAASLGAGIAAYNAGNLAAAERALADAAWHDPDSPLPWYFLGAAKWAAGNAAQARVEFRQGAAREAKSGLTDRGVSTAISAIQGPARSALDAARRE